MPLEVATPTPVLAKEVYLRVRQKMTVEQCVYWLNNALRIITAAGNFPWDQTHDYTPTTGDMYVPIGNNIDFGKKISCFNENNLPIVRVRQDEYDFSGSNYLNTLSGSYYSSYRTGVTPGTGATFLQFFPPVIGPPPSVTIYYHMIPPVLTNTSSSSPRWVNTWMDTLLCDFAEMEIKRILGAPDAATLEERCVARLKDAVTNFSTERENTGPVSDVAAAVAEKTQTGRV